MAIRLAPVRTTRLPLSDGDWIDVKEQLNHGEYHAMHDAVHKRFGGDPNSDPVNFAVLLVTTYLVDWSASVVAGSIRDLPPADVEQRLALLEQDSYIEIKDAIEKHWVAEQRGRVEKKTTRSGGGASLTILPSPAAVAGGMNG